MDRDFKYDIFFSHASEDERLVKQVYEVLRNSGFKVFLSSENLSEHVGQSFMTKVEYALENSEHFVLYCTDNAMDSQWVTIERECFFNQFYLPSKQERRMIMLFAPGFTTDLLPPLMRQIQITHNVMEIVENIRTTATAFDDAILPRPLLEMSEEEIQAANRELRGDILFEFIAVFLQELGLDMPEDADKEGGFLDRTLEAVEQALDDLDEFQEATISLPRLAVHPSTFQEIHYEEVFELDFILTVEGILDLIADRYEDDTGEDFSSNAKHYQRMLNAAVISAIELEEKEESQVRIDGMGMRGSRPYNLRLLVKRDDLWPS